MDRRNFIKAIGVVSLLGVTNGGFAEKKLQWIKMKDDMPKMGQKLIMLVYCVPEHIQHVSESINKTSLLFAERVEDLKPIEWKDIKYSCFKPDYLYSNCFNDRGATTGYRMHYRTGEYFTSDLRRRGKLFHNAIEEKRIGMAYIGHKKFFNWQWENIHENVYWIPLDKCFDDKLPLLPKPIY